MTYGGERWPMKKLDENVLRRTERRMIGMMFGVTLRDKLKSDDLQTMIGLKDDFVKCVTRARYGGIIM
jgi:hypothetical protein